MTEVVNTVTAGIELFATPPLGYVVIIAIVGAGIYFVKKLIGRIPK